MLLAVELSIMASSAGERAAGSGYGKRAVESRTHTGGQDVGQGQPEFSWLGIPKNGCLGVGKLEAARTKFGGGRI